MSYKEAKELFVSGSEGDSITKINVVCLPAITTYALWTLLSPHFNSTRNNPSFRIPLNEFLILVIPLLFGLTLFSAHPLLLNSVLLISIILLTTYLESPLCSPPLSPTISRTPSYDKTSFSQQQTLSKAKIFTKAWITVYRAHMMLMTIICILAVDFKVFPRKFAKAESYGTSIMDLGVGSFVFSLGLISALPILRQKYFKTSVVRDVWISIKKSAGLLVLGFVRVAMVKGVDYPEHVTEYGVHWNFFFTMAILPIFGAGLVRLSPKVDLTLLALIISGCHQMLLSWTSLTEWTLNAARTSLLSQNKEGIVSLPGYLAIYLLGLSTGIYTLPPDPSFYPLLHRELPRTATNEEKARLEEKKVKSWRSRPDRLANLLGSWAVVWWAFFAVVRWFDGRGVSRRLANMTYVLWVTAFNTSFLFLYLLVHIWASSSPTRRSSSAPLIFEAINKNGLVVFLAANLLTGLVNISIESMYANDLLAMIILILYCAATIGVTWVLRGKRLRM